MKSKNLLRIIALLVLVAMLVPALASCSVTTSPVRTNQTAENPGEDPVIDPSEIPVNPYLDANRFLYTIGDKNLAYTYTKSDEKRVRELMSRMDDMLLQGETPVLFVEKYLDLEEEFYEIATQYQLAYIEYCMFQTNKTIEADYLFITELRNEVMTYIYGIYERVYNSDYRDYFYDGWTEEEIAEALELAGVYTEELMELKNLEEQYVVEYRQIPFASADDYALVRSLYLDFVRNGNAIAKQYGYDNYMEYAYAVTYSRDYSVEEAAIMTEYVNQYIAPLVGDLLETFYADMEALQWAAAEENSDVYNEFLYLVLGDGKVLSEQAVELYTGYYATLGQEAVDVFDRLFEEGNYFVSTSTNSYQGAFSWFLGGEVNRPIMFFGGKDYGTPLTFVHEFGHYMSYTLDTSSEQNFDLAEIQSQGDEMLFMTYMYNVYDSRAVDLAITYQLVLAMANMLNSMYVNAFETYVYANIDNITADQLDAIYAEIMGEEGYAILSQLMNGPDKYWYYVTIESPGYYISYGMSMIPSLELLVLANEDYEAAADAYMALVQNSTEGFCDPLKGAGLYTPFEEEAYISIAEYLSALIGADE